MCGPNAQPSFMSYIATVHRWQQYRRIQSTECCLFLYVMDQLLMWN